MNTLRHAVQEYLTLRRSLGFKLYKAGKLLPAFVKFMEERRASSRNTHNLSTKMTAKIPQFARYREKNWAS
jgi:hypothetical protein